MAELVEGAPLLREYGVKSSIEGSNPSLSARFQSLKPSRVVTTTAYQFFIIGFSRP